MEQLTIIIPTYNEAKHIERCIQNLNSVADRILVIDSFSSDATCETAASLGAEVFQNEFVNYATQFNWALANCPIDTPWTMRMDCDEYLTSDLIREINETLPRVSDEVTGFIIKRRVIFMNRWIRHGGFYPHRLLRIWRTGTGKVEDRWMDEHVVIEDENAIIETLQHDMVDHNLNNFTWWIEKHNSYATREMRDMLALNRKKSAPQNAWASLSGGQSSRKRWIKENVYARIPFFIRPFAYFVYRYFLLLGFLDGSPGLIWHFSQALWYRFLVDAKMYEEQLNRK